MHRPFIAVDTRPALEAGRRYWDLPKVEARFSEVEAPTVAGSSGGGSGPRGVPTRADGSGWTLEARARPFGPPLWVWFRFLIEQASEGGEVSQTRISVRGRGRLARVTVSSSQDTVGPPVGDGRHGGVAIDAGVLRLGVRALIGSRNT